MFFKHKHDRVPPILRNIFLLNLKEIRMCCSMFSESWCIPFAEAATNTNLNNGKNKH